MVKICFLFGIDFNPFHTHLTFSKKSRHTTIDLCQTDACLLHHFSLSKACLDRLLKWIDYIPEVLHPLPRSLGEFLWQIRREVKLFLRNMECLAIATANVRELLDSNKSNIITYYKILNYPIRDCLFHNSKESTNNGNYIFATLSTEYNRELCTTLKIFR